MHVDQALRALSQLQKAAPPTTSARLNDVMILLRELNEENTVLASSLALPVQPMPNLIPQAFNTLRPSLTLVRGQAQMLRGGRLGRLTTEQGDCLKLIEDHAATSLLLLETLDEILLMQEGALPVEPLVFSGLDLLAEAWQQRYQAAEAREHHINIHADDPLPNVIGDYHHILAIVVDLIDNAIRYTPLGGAIRITAETLGTHILFSVADNGIGFDSADMEQIGQPFWRATHQPLVRQHPGTGLRLYRANAILQIHGSELFFSGEPGMGSTFSFALPTG